MSHAYCLPAAPDSVAYTCMHEVNDSVSRKVQLQESINMMQPSSYSTRHAFAPFLSFHLHLNC